MLHLQDKVRASMVKPEDPKDMQIRKLPSKGTSASALRDKLKYKASCACHASAACCELQRLPSWQAAAGWQACCMCRFIQLMIQKGWRAQKPTAHRHAPALRCIYTQGNRPQQQSSSINPGAYPQEAKDLQIEEGHSTVSGALYMAGKEHRQLLVDTYGLYSHTNPIHSDVFPSVRQLEAEVLAMVASMLGGDLGPGHALPH